MACTLTEERHNEIHEALKYVIVNKARVFAKRTALQLGNSFDAWAHYNLHHMLKAQLNNANELIDCANVLLVIARKYEHGGNAANILEGILKDLRDGIDSHLSERYIRTLADCSWF